MRSLLNWQEAFDAGTTICGGKGWNLARLHRCGFDIPDGAVLSADIYRRLIEQEAIASQIKTISEIPENKLTSARAGNALEQLQQSIKTQILPRTVCDDIRHFLQREKLTDTPLAIRSSATPEDGETASFAGIHESFLNIRGEAAVGQAVLDCFASLWSLRAVGYRRKMKIGDDEIAAAVVVMPLIDAQTSGVAFSCDPVSGRTDVSLVNANFGFGESVVSGVAEPDQFYLDSYRQRILSRRLGKKEKQTVLNRNGGTQLQPSADPGARNTLTDEQLLQLNRLILRVFYTLGEGERHQDIEWVHDGKRFWLVQARPVTALPLYTVPELKGQAQTWSNGNFRDAIPMVVPPLIAPFCQWHIDHILVESLTQIGYPLPGGINFSKYFRGRFYCNASLMQWVWYDAAGLEPRITNLNMGGHQHELIIDYRQHDALLKKIQRLLRTLKFLKQLGHYKKRAPQIYRQAACWVDERMKNDLSALSDEALLALYWEIDNKATEYDIPFIILTCASGAGTMLIQTLEKKFANEALSVASALLAGEGEITSADHGYRLHEIAGILEADPAAGAWLHTPGYNANDWQRLPDDSPFKQAFQQFLDEYGHRAVYEMDLSRPRWREDPSYLLDIIKNIPNLSSLNETRARQKQQTEKAWKRVKQAFPRLMHHQIRSMVKNAAQGAACKEAAKSTYVRLLAPMRKVILEVGRRLYERGLIDQIHDIFFCTPPELEAVFKEEWPGRELKRLVEERKQRTQQLEAQAAPDVIIDDAPAYVPPQTEAGTDTLQGIAVAAGIAQGSAYVARTPEQGTDMPSGAVLAAPSTDPAWTPLFLNAAALVMETGGYLSHGSIVAREYGIPAVVNVPGIFSVIKKGDTVEVNGDQGRVKVLS